LSGDPPAADLLRLRRIGEIEDHHYVADIALGRRRDIGVAAIEIIAVHALAVGAPLGDQAGTRGIGDIVDAESAAELRIAVRPLPLVIDDHDAVGNAHLVGVPAGGHFDARKDLRIERIGDVDDRGPCRLPHVADVESRPVDPDLPAARTVDMGEPFGIPAVRHPAANQTKRTVSPDASRPCFW
jgi:hypothetical protein